MYRVENQRSQKLNILSAALRNITEILYESCGEISLVKFVDDTEFD